MPRPKRKKNRFSGTGRPRLAESSDQKRYDAARAKREEARAELASLDVKVAEGKLVDRMNVEKREFETGRAIREELFNIPERCAGILAAESDQDKVYQILRKEITQSCSALQTLPPAEKPRRTRKAKVEPIGNKRARKVAKRK